MSVSPVTQLGFHEALSMASIFTRRLSPRVNEEIKRNGYHPYFKVSGGKVFLTYGDRMVIATGSTEADFLDWVETHRVVVKAVELLKVEVVDSPPEA